MTQITSLATPRVRSLAVALGVATFKPALVVAAFFGMGALVVVAIIAFIAIFASEERRESALSVLRAIFGRKSLGHCQVSPDPAFGSDPCLRCTRCCLSGQPLSSGGLPGVAVIPQPRLPGRDSQLAVSMPEVAHCCRRGRRVPGYRAAGGRRRPQHRWTGRLRPRSRNWQSCSAGWRACPVAAPRSR